MEYAFLTTPVTVAPSKAGSTPSSDGVRLTRCDDESFEQLLYASQARDNEAACRALPRSHWLQPKFIATPEPDSIAQPNLRRLLSYWTQLRGDRRLPHQCKIDPIEMRDLLGFINLLDVVNDGDDFRHRLCGSKIADAQGADFTGSMVSAAASDRYEAAFLQGSCRAVVKDPSPLITVHCTLSQQRSITWTRLVLPLADDSGAVTRILIGCVLALSSFNSAIVDHR